MSEQNKAIARVAFEVWSNGDLDRLDQYIAADVVHHDPYDPNGLHGLAGMKKTIARNRELTPDLSITIDDQIAEGNGARHVSRPAHQHDRQEVESEAEAMALQQAWAQWAASAASRYHA